MVDDVEINEAVPVGKIFLFLSNYRHEPFDTEEEAIEYLCTHEQVYPLARDIARRGVNPLERFGLIPIKTGRASKAAPNYQVAEGNRRFCALKLLSDPDKAPAKLRKAFEKLAATWTPIKTVPGVIFPDLASIKVWLDRVHNGAQGGIGRREWNADQKSRAGGGNKNKAALALLDYAEAEKMITAQERKGNLTTVQRFVVNDVFRETLGLDTSNLEDVGRSRPKEDFDVLLKRFLRDLLEKKVVNSRMNKEPIIKYARSLNSLPGLTSDRVETESLLSPKDGGSAKSNGKKGRRRKPDRLRRVEFDVEIYNLLSSLNNSKLLSLYNSICQIDLVDHTPLIAVGAWSFFETLTACAGRVSGTSFESFLSKGRLAQFGLAATDNVTYRAALERVREYGNTTKHHPISATFNGEQLNNDLATLKPVIAKSIEEAISKGNAPEI